MRHTMASNPRPIGPSSRRNTWVHDLDALHRSHSAPNNSLYHTSCDRNNNSNSNAIGYDSVDSLDVNANLRRPFTTTSTVFRNQPNMSRESPFLLDNYNSASIADIDNNNTTNYSSYHDVCSNKRDYAIVNNRNNDDLTDVTRHCYNTNTNSNANSNIRTDRNNNMKCPKSPDNSNSYSKRSSIDSTEGLNSPTPTGKHHKLWERSDSLPSDSGFSSLGCLSDDNISECNFNDFKTSPSLRLTSPFIIPIASFSSRSRRSRSFSVDSTSSDSSTDSMCCDQLIFSSSLPSNYTTFTSPLNVSSSDETDTENEVLVKTKTICKTDNLPSSKIIVENTNHCFNSSSTNNYSPQRCNSSEEENGLSPSEDISNPSENPKPEVHCTLSPQPRHRPSTIRDGRMRTKGHKLNKSRRQGGSMTSPSIGNDVNNNNNRTLESLGLVNLLPVRLTRVFQTNGLLALVGCICYTLTLVFIMGLLSAVWAVLSLAISKSDLKEFHHNVSEKRRRREDKVAKSSAADGHFHMTGRNQNHRGWGHHGLGLQ